MVWTSRPPPIHPSERRREDRAQRTECMEDPSLRLRQRETLPPLQTSLDGYSPRQPPPLHFRETETTDPSASVCVTAPPRLQLNPHKLWFSKQGWLSHAPPRPPGLGLLAWPPAYPQKGARGPVLTSGHTLHPETESSGRGLGGEVGRRLERELSCAPHVRRRLPQEEPQRGSGSPRGDKWRRTLCPGRKWAPAFLDGAFAHLTHRKCPSKGGHCAR